MPSTSVALQDEAQPLKRMQVRGKLKAALDAMVWEGMPLTEAARNCKITAFAIRKAMEKPHVLAYVRSEKQMLRESVSARNIHRLREIRDAADNMPAIQAIRTLEQMGDDHLGGGAVGVSHSPGVTIRIIHQAPAEQRPIVDITPQLSSSSDD